MDNPKTPVFFATRELTRSLTRLRSSTQIDKLATFSPVCVVSYSPNIGHSFTLPTCLVQLPTLNLRLLLAGSHSSWRSCHQSPEEPRCAEYHLYNPIKFICGYTDRQVAFSRIAAKTWISSTTAVKRSLSTLPCHATTISAGLQGTPPFRCIDLCRTQSHISIRPEQAAAMVSL